MNKTKNSLKEKRIIYNHKRLLKQQEEISQLKREKMTFEQLKKRTEILNKLHNKSVNIEELERKVTTTNKVVLDVETTGFSSKYDEMLQISAINEHGEILLNEYIKPLYTTEWKEAQKVHGITPEKVKNCPTVNDLWEKVQLLLLSANEIIGYNVEFDLLFLQAIGIMIPDVKITDVMIEFADVYKEWSSDINNYKCKSLFSCADFYGYNFKAHDSLADCEATLYCLNRIRGE